MNIPPNDTSAAKPPGERLTPEQVIERVGDILDTYDSTEALATVSALVARVSNKHAVSFEDTVTLVAHSLRSNLRPKDVRRAAATKNAKALVALHSKLLHDVMNLKSHKAHVSASLATVLTALYVDDLRLHPVVDALLFRAHLDAIVAHGRDPIIGILQLWEQHINYFSSNDGMRLLLGALSSFARDRHIDTSQLLIMLATTFMPPQGHAPAPNEDAASTAGPADATSDADETALDADEHGDGVH